MRKLSPGVVPRCVGPPEGGSNSILASEHVYLTCKPGPRGLGYAPFVPSSRMVSRADEGPIPGRNYRGWLPPVAAENSGRRRAKGEERG
jgi:hypothetical protein